jgi:hypothetical protein
MSNGDGGTGGFLSQQKAPEGRSWLPWVIAGVVVVAVLVWFLVSGHRQRVEQLAAQQADIASQTPDPYAAQLSTGNLQMSEASNFTGSKVTYLDGTITNKGSKTVSAVNVVVTFHNDIGEPPQQTPMPLTLIRTREPYVDIEPVSAEPLKPGESHDFRLIFDHISPTWNQQFPTIQVKRVEAR